jgi:hypothetical protein
MAFEDETPEEFLAKLEAYGKGEWVPPVVDTGTFPEGLDPNSFHGRSWELELAYRERADKMAEDMGQYLTLSEEDRKAWDDADPLNQWTRAEAAYLQPLRRPLP